ncbi:glycosyltransferase family 4 protein [Nocardioides sp. QY071]|uniref:glycosyltransferase family 4 protein n=1 Tax=Nocardioides sp. QY071 TaxID=3044187 RepID=UPI00249B802B|nr:glycosyltransferase family 4 protein [Nocardioides sp. QY071]WGY04528.1 glycosyltransferase family 4 protein [Nocardioides sp. QY071]
MTTYATPVGSRRPLRIGLIAPPWIPVPPPAYGGTEAVIANLARGLTERGHHVELFTVGTSSCPVPRGHLFDTPVEPFGQSVPEAAHVLAAYDALRHVDIIHDHTVLGPLLAPHTLRGGPPVVTTNHGPFTPLTRPIFKEIARGAAVVAISHDHASRAGDVPITAVIHHGVDLETYRLGAGTRDDLVFVGRMSPDKGVDAAVRIAHAAGRPLRIVSKMREPDEVEYFRTCVRPLLSATEDDVAELATAERVDLVGRSAGLVNPIAWPEPFGLVMIEALATGTPVVTRPMGAAPEIVTQGRTGFLADREAEAVAAVGRLRTIDRATCRSEVSLRFSLQRMAADHEDLYHALLAAPPASGRRPLRSTRAGTPAVRAR